MPKSSALAIPVESRIFVLRQQKVILDRDLAELYGVPVKRLNEQVKRNSERFPDDFMFELTKDEVEELLKTIVPSGSQIANLKRGYNIKYLPFAFSEHGVLMLSSVLRSEQAIQVNIQIMRVYSKMKELLVTHKDILLKLEQLEKMSLTEGYRYIDQFIEGAGAGPNSSAECGDKNE